VIRGVRVVVFDLDDTLFPESQFVLGGFAAAGERLRLERGIEGLSRRTEELFAAGRRANLFDLALEELGVSAEAGLVARLVEAYRSHVPRLALFPDADEILKWSGTKYSLGLITDGPAAVQQSKIRALGLEARIPCRVVTDELGRECWKPSAIPYQRVMKRWGGSGGEYLYIGDNPAKDFIGARRLGWRTIRIRRKDGEHSSVNPPVGHEADCELADLRELPKLLLA
jgi:putative hydrolase of the HAD superfamily